MNQQQLITEMSRIQQEQQAQAYAEQIRQMQEAQQEQMRQAMNQTVQASPAGQAPQISQPQMSSPPLDPNQALSVTEMLRSSPQQVAPIQMGGNVIPVIPTQQKDSTGGLLQMLKYLQ